MTEMVCWRSLAQSRKYLYRSLPPLKPLDRQRPTAVLRPRRVDALQHNVSVVGCIFTVLPRSFRATAQPFTVTAQCFSAAAQLFNVIAQLFNVTVQCFNAVAQLA